MKIIQAEVYTFEELSEKAKEKAIEELTTMNTENLLTFMYCNQCKTASP